ncbi:uncharacterized protein GGS22DRAFT_193342 [Annulohypoxylon maeteangense]|uniref:uncharacterized protein n=1 Tax=Annulohypoxylon maeteangense TaxID=1927788 RepID=UPI002007ADCC|nr:uncharacterized protein GGS22DRAFT_193342 [Annulohypoxylon maeteangense]KAI0880417.1 hypothetical protein GGS22DRAFT_193342 [Annulohypoxylon maeteangense]
MSMTVFMTVAVGFAGQLANAQGLITNCTWQTGLMVDNFLGMYCNNDDWARYSYDWTWLDTNGCLANSGGNLYPYGRQVDSSSFPDDSLVLFICINMNLPYHSGNYWSTCDNCTVHGSNANFLLSCDCLNANGRFSPATYDLNRVIWNHNGVLGCFDHVGNRTEKGPF